MVRYPEDRVQQEGPALATVLVAWCGRFRVELPDERPPQHPLGQLSGCALAP
jgi:hypothetical protein